MLHWIRTFAAVFGCSVFFILFFICLAGENEFSLQSIALSLVRGFIGASLAWVVGIVIADILLKGVISDIPGDREELLEGGLVQRVHDIRNAALPGGAEMPFSSVMAIGKKHRNGTAA
ncbi:MAG: hypothetical protein JXA71_11105 [Chitinispirillaceae bacterium]|nr:hypothetical protein [Chitinispirillaceae bacterium]